MMEITRKCQGQLCDPGEKAIFTCITNINKPDMSCTWLQHNKPLDDRMADRVKIFSKENVFTLEILNCQVEDSGQYTCRITDNTGDSLACSAQLEVHQLSAAEKTERELSNHPVFISKLRDTELISKSTASFMIHVKGNPNPDVKFTKDGTEISSTNGRVFINKEHGHHGSYELIIHQVESSDAGTYSVLAVNNISQVECSSIITVKDAKDVFALLKGHERRVSAGGEPTFTWFKSGQEFDPEDRFKVLFKDDEDTLALVFKHISPEDVGLYTCVASTSTGKISCSAELSIEGGVTHLLKDPEPPKILSILSDSSTNIGGSVMMELKMKGYPRPNIKWTKDGQRITPGDRFKLVYPDQETVTLFINKVIGEDIGAYKVTLSNDLGEVSSECNLTLSGAPQFKEKIENQKCGIDEAWKIVVSVSGNPELTWYKDGVPIVENARIKSEKINAETFELNFQKTESDDNGNWAVIARNEHGEMSQFFTFSAQMLPKFESKLVDIESNEGKQAILKCVIKCTPAPKITWYKEDVDVTNDSRFKCYKDPNGNDCLMIGNCSRSIAGEYEIRASNDMGVASSKCNVKINTKPSCDDMEDAEAFENDNHVFKIECDGNPKPICKWTKDGKPIDTKDGHYSISEASGAYKLIITGVKMDDAGNFQAEFSNRAGDRKVSAVLNVHPLSELAIPKCMTDLKEKKANKGAKTFFQLKIRGDPLPEVKWYLNDNEILDNDHFKTSIKDDEFIYRLDVLDINEDHCGRIKVVAKNENGLDEKETTLEVMFEPEVTEMGEVKGGPGDTVKISSKIRAFPDAEIIWYKKSKLSEEEEELKLDKIDALEDKKWERFSTEMEKDGIWEIHSLIIKDAILEDAGDYVVSATNYVGHTEGLSFLNIITEEPSFIKALHDITIKLGSTVTFEAIVTGIPKPEVAWYRGDKELKKGKRVLLEESTTEGGALYAMTIRDIVMKDFGEIMLKASNIVGEAVSVCTFQIVQIPPTIEAEFPRMQEAKEGAEFVLTAKIDGSPAPNAIWLCEGEKIGADPDKVIFSQEETEDGNGTFITMCIKKVSDENNGKYTLLVTNTAGETKLETILDVLGKPKAPKLIQEITPNTITIPGNKELRLQCKITGFPTPLIKWFRDGNEIKVRKGVLVSQDASGNGNFLLEKCLVTDAGVYMAKGINEIGEVETSCNVSVTQPLEEPKFVSLLRSCKAVEGSPIKLEGKILGHPKSEIKWLKDEQEFKPDGERIKEYINNDGTFGLTFYETSMGDKGTYTAIAYNSEGTARTNANVGIKTRLQEGVEKSPPSFHRLLGDIDVDEGQTLRITTPIKGNPIPEFSWTKDDKPIEGERVNLFSDGNLIGLQIVGVTMEDIGVYECHLNNELGTIKSACNARVLKIYKPPIFSKQLSNIKQLLKCDARFICDVSSNPKPNVSWTFNGKSIEDGGRYKIKNNGSIRTLVVKAISEVDAGIYRCHAVNKEGSAESKSTLEIVEYIEQERCNAPEFMKKIGDEMVFRGMAARFTALVTGNPEPDYEFSKEGKKIYSDDRIHINKERNGLIRMSFNYVEESDIGVYKLRIFNKHGEAHCEARLVYDGLEIQPGQSLGDLYQGFDRYTTSGLPMPLPDKPLITQMSDTRVSLTWKPSIPLGPNLAPYYTIEMAEYPDGDWVEVYEEVRGITCDINNLTPLRDYRFRVSVRNRYGLSEASPYCVSHRSLFASDIGFPDIYLKVGEAFDLRSSTKFPKGFDIYKEPYGGFIHRPHFLRQDEICQYAVKNSCPSFIWNLYGFPMPQLSFKFEGKDIEIGDSEKYTFNYTRNGIVSLQINGFQSSDVGTYECWAKNEHGEMNQAIIARMAQYPEFIVPPSEVNLIGVNGGKVECQVFGIPKPTIKWYKDYHQLRETSRVQLHHYPPETYTLFFEDYITKDEGLYTITASNLCGSISYSVIVRILEDEQEYEWMAYRRSKQIIPSTKGFDKYYHKCEEIGRGTQGVTYFVQQTVPIEADQSGHHVIDEAESKYWWLHRNVKEHAPTIDPIMVPYRFTGGNFAAKTMRGSGQLKTWMMNELENMNILHHPRLIRLVEAYNSKEEMTLITELATGGELLDVITLEKYITEIEVARIIKQLLEGLEYMHSKSIGHLGLTPLDILYVRPGGAEIKICDFSLSKRIVGSTKLDYGQPEYVAPEIVNNEGASLASDMWSLGIITYVLLSGISPFRGQNDRETLQRIQMGDIDFDFELWQNISREAKHFVANLLVYKPEERMSVRQALVHPWLQILKQPGIEISKQYQISTERLRTYYIGLKEWQNMAACEDIFRRRPLSGAFTHPSCMVYPTGTLPEPENVPQTNNIEAAEEWRRASYAIETFENQSNYQNGPDTYLLQVRDAYFPTRLREYLKVARMQSSEFQEVSIPIIKERRRFIDVMEEEFELQRDPYLKEWEDTKDMSIYELHQMKQAERNVPFFREKPSNFALEEGKVLEIKCLVAAEPKLSKLMWYKNDLLIEDDSRVNISNSDGGRSIMTLYPAASSDAGLYKVVARNNVGEANSTVRVVLGDISGPTDSPSIEAMTDTDILISWKTPSQLNHTPIICYKVQMGYIDTDIDWVDLADDIKHEYFVIDNLRPSHGYKFRVTACNKFGWSLPSIPSPIAMTPSSGQRKADFYDALQRLQAREDHDAEEEALRSYECETQPIKMRQGSGPALDFMSEITKGRFSFTANIKCNTKICMAKIFDKNNSEGRASALREFKHLKELNHEHIVTLVDAYETEKMFLLMYQALPGINILAYLSEKSVYSEQMVAEVLDQIINALSYIQWRGRLYLNLEPGNIIVSSGRCLGKTLWVKLINFENTQTSNACEVKGTTYNFDYAAPEIIKKAQAYPESDVWSLGVLLYLLLSGQLPFKGESTDETRNNIVHARFRHEWLYKETTIEATRLLMWVFKKNPSKRPSLTEIQNHKWLSQIDYLFKKRERTQFTTNRIKKFSQDYHFSRPQMELDGETFFNKLL